MEKHSNTCANEISFMYKINLSRSPRFLPDVKMASKGEDERGICENIPFLGQIRLPWFVGPTINLKLLSPSYFEISFLSLRLINFWTSFVSAGHSSLDRCFIAASLWTDSGYFEKIWKGFLTYSDVDNEMYLNFSRVFLSINFSH